MQVQAQCGRQPCASHSYWSLCVRTIIISSSYAGLSSDLYVSNSVPSQHLSYTMLKTSGGGSKKRKGPVKVAVGSNDGAMLATAAGVACVECEK